MAGSEKAGVASATADLFDGRMVVVTQPPEQRRNDEGLLQAANQMREFWESLGAEVVTMDADQHDVAVAAVSHLPHVVASALSAATEADFLKLAATGWRDTTRVAGGDPELWRQILMENRTHVLQAMDNFANVLDSFRDGLRNGDAAQLVSLLTAGKQNRDTVGN